MFLFVFTFLFALCCRADTRLVTGQALEDNHGGWLNSSIVPAFEAYADTCFKEYGNKVGALRKMLKISVVTLYFDHAAVLVNSANIHSAKLDVLPCTCIDVKVAG